MIRYAISGFIGLLAIVVVGWVAIPRHPSPPPAPQVMEREEAAYGKGDLLFVHRDPPPLPAPEVTAASVVVDAEPPPKRERNICERNGGVKIERGRSWHCRYPKRK